MTRQEEPGVSVVPPVAVVVGVVAAVVAGVFVSFRVGGLLLAALLGVAACARLLLPVRVVGPLAVRSRLMDVVTLTVLGVSVAVLAVTAPDA